MTQEHVWMLIDRGATNQKSALERAMRPRCDMCGQFAKSGQMSEVGGDKSTTGALVPDDPLCVCKWCAMHHYGISIKRQRTKSECQPQATVGCVAPADSTAMTVGEQTEMPTH